MSDRPAMRRKRLDRHAPYFAADAVASRLRLIVNATSLGGVETLLEHRRTSEGPTSQAPPNLLRLSVGLESADDLLDDLRQALDG